MPKKAGTKGPTLRLPKSPGGLKVEKSAKPTTAKVSKGKK